MQSAATPWTVGAISLGGELALCWYLLSSMSPTYAPGEGVFLQGVIPGVLMLFYAYHLVHMAKLWSRSASPPMHYGRALALQVAGGVCGLGGLWLAAVGGPHIAPFFVLWALLLQLVAIWLARRVLVSSRASENGNRGA